jgi:molybdopterin converting factor small subunit
MNQSIEVQVRLFASARECVGAASLAQTLPAGAAVGDLVSCLYEAYPGLRDLRLRFALNAAYCDLDAKLRDGDELACIPPVGGG